MPSINDLIAQALSGAGNGSLIVTGTFEANGDLSVTGDFSVVGGADVSGNLAVTGAATIGSTLGVTGLATAAALTATGAVILSNASVKMTNLPTSDPTVAGRLYTTDGALMVSAG